MSTIILTGRIGKDAELRHLQDNMPVLSFSIADEIGYGDKRTVQWVQCAMFGKRAESVAPYVTKGSTVEVVGSPTVEAWVKKGTSEAQAAIKVRVSELKLHGGKSAEPSHLRDKAPARSNTSDDDSEMPF